LRRGRLRAAPARRDHRRSRRHLLELADRAEEVGVSAPTVGTRLPDLEVPAVSAEKMKTMAALLAGPTPIHFDPAAVAAAGLGERPVNQGPLHLGYVMNLLVGFAGGHDRLRRIRVRF